MAKKSIVKWTHARMRSCWFCINVLPVKNSGPAHISRTGISASGNNISLQHVRWKHHNSYRNQRIYETKTPWTWYFHSMNIPIHVHFRLRCCPCPILCGWPPHLSESTTCFGMCINHAIIYDRLILDAPNSSVCHEIWKQIGHMASHQHLRYQTLIKFNW